jgi:hypothetical protein
MNLDETVWDKCPGIRVTIDPPPLSRLDAIMRRYFTISSSLPVDYTMEISWQPTSAGPASGKMGFSRLQGRMPTALTLASPSRQSEDHHRVIHIDCWAVDRILDTDSFNGLPHYYSDTWAAAAQERPKWVATTPLIAASTARLSPQRAARPARLASSARCVAVIPIP